MLLDSDRYTKNESRVCVDVNEFVQDIKVK